MARKTETAGPRRRAALSLLLARPPNVLSSWPGSIASKQKIGFRAASWALCVKPWRRRSGVAAGRRCVFNQGLCGEQACTSCLCVRVEGWVPVTCWKSEVRQVRHSAPLGCGRVHARPSRSMRRCPGHMTPEVVTTAWTPCSCRILLQKVGAEAGARNLSEPQRRRRSPQGLRGEVGEVSMRVGVLWAAPGGGPTARCLNRRDYCGRCKSVMAFRSDSQQLIK